MIDVLEKVIRDAITSGAWVPVVGMLVAVVAWVCLMWWLLNGRLLERE